MKHPDHQMQLTSLFCYYGDWNQEQFNQTFRQETKRKIIMLLSKHPNLTDREMSELLNFKDPNRIRPRRNELSNKKYYDPPIVVEDLKRKCNVGKKQSIAWRLSRNNLMGYLS